MAEKITKYHPIGSETFLSVCMNIFEIWSLYVKNITFAYSLLTLTSTWHSNHHNGPGGYMCGELKSENINTEKAPTRRSHHPAQDHLNHPINYNYIRSKILVKRTQVTIPLQNTKTLKRLKDPLRLQFTCEYNKKPITSNHSLREALEFKIITFLLTLLQEDPQRSN
jgi:hypothetical protein